MDVSDFLYREKPHHGPYSQRDFDEADRVIRVFQLFATALSDEYSAVEDVDPETAKSAAQLTVAFMVDQLSRTIREGRVLP